MKPIGGEMRLSGLNKVGRAKEAAQIVGAEEWVRHDVPLVAKVE
jgi:hypothetical protein